MVYCISDIHGELDKFCSMLDLIKFSDADTLYIIGDAIDRHPQGVDVLKRIMAAPNMVMVMGNHELMCLDALVSVKDRVSLDRWYHNGGLLTHHDLADCSTADRRAILRYLGSLPDHLDIEVDKRQFHLVHGFPSDNTLDRVWGRPQYNPHPQLPNGTVIIGHTPTCLMTEQYQEPYTIYHGKGYIDIDCGCAGQDDFRRLGCLRLDDMQEFYI